MTTSAMDPESMKPARTRGLALLVVLIVSSLYVLRHLDRGWVPFDDGALAQAAERALRGELPHRDFDDIYTGGLALWDALVFRAAGINLLALRDALFMLFVLWMPAVYYLASRVATPARAAFVTFLCVVWSLPNYNAAMPSWYNLFLGTFAVAAIARYIETEGRRWLVVAGVAVGLSILVKIVGLYLAAAALLVFVNEEQIASRRAAGAPGGEGDRRVSWFVTVSLGLFIGALALLLWRRAYPAELLQFFAPGALLAAYLIRREWTTEGAPARARLARLAGLIGPFLLGVIVPVALFLVPYVRSGSVPALLTGVFVVPTRRFAVATMRLPPVWTMLAALGPIGLVWMSWRVRRSARWYESALLAIGVAALVRAAGTNEELYRWIWYSARALFPLFVLAGLYLLAARRPVGRATPRVQRLTYLLLAATAMASLVQYPFAAPNYFTYVAPLIILSGLTLLAWIGPTSPVPLRALLAVYLLFGMFRMNISLLTRMGASHVPYAGTKPLTMERGGGLRVSHTEAEIYNAIVPALRAHARGGYTWASPDLPEIYFLSGLRNPTRALFDFLGDESNRADQLIQLLDAHGITAVVVNLNPYYSPAPSPDVIRALERRFPNAQEFGPYQLRWRS